MFLHVPQPLPEQRQDVFVVERVVNETAVPARPYDPRVPEQAQLVRYRGLRQAEKLREMADALLAARQDVQNPHARRVAEDFEDVRKGAHGIRLEETLGVH